MSTLQPFHRPAVPTALRGLGLHGTLMAAEDAVESHPHHALLASMSGRAGTWVRPRTIDVDGDYVIFEIARLTDRQRVILNAARTIDRSSEKLRDARQPVAPWRGVLDDALQAEREAAAGRLDQGSANAALAALVARSHELAAAAAQVPIDPASDDLSQEETP